MPRPIFLCAPLAALISLSSTLCFSADNARWYRVELMVFSQSASQVSESWPPTPELAYPANLQFLIQGDQLPLITDSAAAEEAGLDAGTEFGDSAVPGPMNDPNNPQATGAVDEKDTGGTAIQDPDSQMADAGAVIDTLLPTSFALLPRSSMEFRGKGAYMERQGGYEVLFHEHWAQLIGPKAESPHIVLPSRSALAGWPKLQGTVQLHLARYLHIETNLWLNTQGEALPRGWKMPAPPQGPITPYSTAEERAVQEANPGVLAPALAEKPVQPAIASADGNSVDPLLENTEGNLAMVEPEPELNQVYPFRHAVLMQQKRRMRSIEVHYIDHPLFGIVIKLTPLDEEELAVLAGAEPRPE